MQRKKITKPEKRSFKPIIINYLKNSIYKKNTIDTITTQNTINKLIFTSGEKGSYWLSLSGSTTAWLYICVRMCFSIPRDGRLLRRMAGRLVPFSCSKNNNKSINDDNKKTMCFSMTRAGRLLRWVAGRLDTVGYDRGRVV